MLKRPTGGAFTFVFGGARSGKSALAERIARATGLPKTYIATAEAFDDEMTAKIARHQADRGGDWRTIEAPRALAEAVVDAAGPERVVLIDCLTLWLSNRMLDLGDVDRSDQDAALSDATDAVLAAIAAAGGPVVAVSNEVGCGIAPATSLGRRFRDAQGRLNQRAAAAADRVLFVAAGLSIPMKGRAATPEESEALA